MSLPFHSHQMFSFIPKASSVYKIAFQIQRGDFFISPVAFLGGTDLWNFGEVLISGGKMSSWERKQRQKKVAFVVSVLLFGVPNPKQLLKN